MCHADPDTPLAHELRHKTFRARSVAHPLKGSGSWSHRRKVDARLLFKLALPAHACNNGPRPSLYPSESSCFSEGRRCCRSTSLCASRKQHNSSLFSGVCLLRPSCTMGLRPWRCMIFAVGAGSRMRTTNNTVEPTRSGCRPTSVMSCCGVLRVIYIGGPPAELLHGPRAGVCVLYALPPTRGLDPAFVPGLRGNRSAVFFSHRFLTNAYLCCPGLYAGIYHQPRG